MEWPNFPIYFYYVHVRDHKFIDFMHPCLQQISINPLRKRDGKRRRLSNVPVATVSDLKQYVCSILQAPDEEHADFELGYYECGHGAKGKRDG